MREHQKRQRGCSPVAVAVVAFRTCLLAPLIELVLQTKRTDCLPVSVVGKAIRGYFTHLQTKTKFESKVHFGRFMSETPSLSGWLTITTHIAKH